MKSINFHGFLHVLILLCMTLRANGIACFACLPSIEGGTVSKNLALSWRANISRTWSGRTEDSFGECEDMNLDPKFQVICPDKTINGACLEISNEFWTTRTCGTLRPDRQSGCFPLENSQKMCFCQGDMCNGTFKIQGCVVGLVGCLVLLLLHFNH